MDKRTLCEEIGRFYGEFFEKDGHLHIDNGEKLFLYDTEDDLLKDWLETLIESHYYDYHIDEQGRKWDCWEDEIVFIYENVFGEFPAGITPVESATDKVWESSVAVEDGSEHGRTLDLGFYFSIVDAIYARREFLERFDQIDRNQPDFIKNYLALADAVKVKMEQVEKDRVEEPEVPELPNQEAAVAAAPQVAENYDTVKNLISAMVAYGLEFNKNDSDIIDSLVGVGLTHEDFICAGYSYFVRDYFAEEEFVVEPVAHVLDAEIAYIHDKPFMERTGAEQEKLYTYWFSHSPTGATPLHAFMGMSFEELRLWQEGSLCLQDGSYHEMEPCWIRLPPIAVAAVRKMLDPECTESYSSLNEQFEQAIPAGFRNCFIAVDFDAVNIPWSHSALSVKDYLVVYDPSDDLIAVIGEKDMLYKEDFALLMKEAGLDATEVNFRSVMEKFPANIVSTIHDTAKVTIRAVLTQMQKKTSLDTQIQSAADQAKGSVSSQQAPAKVAAEAR